MIFHNQPGTKTACYRELNEDGWCVLCGFRQDKPEPEPVPAQPDEWAMEEARRALKEIGEGRTYSVTFSDGPEFRANDLWLAGEVVVESLAALLVRVAERQHGWVSVEDRLPDPGVPVLAFVGPNSFGHTRRVRAQYSDGKSLSVSDDALPDEQWPVYDEEKDEYFCPVGWFETNEYEETHWQVDGSVTHWQPLPAPPPSPAEVQPKQATPEGRDE